MKKNAALDSIKKNLWKRKKNTKILLEAGVPNNVN